MEKRKNVIAYAALIAFGIVFYLQTLKIKKMEINTIPDSFIPQAACILMIVLCIIQLIRSAAEKKTDSVQEEDKQTEREKLKKVGILCVVFALAVALMKPLGFVIDIALLLFTLFMMLAPKEERTKKKMLIFAVISPVITFAVFYVFLNVFSALLPMGVLKFLA